MYKIFFKDRVVCLTDRLEADLTPQFGAIHKLGSEGELKKFLADFENNKTRREAFIYHFNTHELLQRCRSCYKNLLAAGGLVWNKSHDHFLAIEKLGRPDLPKGKVEPHESFEFAAQREIFEECGIDRTKILAPLGPTFHTYKIGEETILKETQWFEMISENDAIPKAQAEEGISRAFWVSRADAPKFAKETYPSVREILKKAQSL